MRKHYIVILLAIFIFRESYSQKYNFVNWTVEDGLMQSQASYLCQDDYHQLWIATLGGLCRFDGKSFKGYTMQDGLLSNHANVVCNDGKGNLWIGTGYGISVFNGKSFKNIKLTSAPVNNVNKIQQVGEMIYAISDSRLFSIRDYIPKKIFISNDTNERVVALGRTGSKQLLALVNKKGLYLLANSGWKLLAGCDPAKTIGFRDVYITLNSDTLIGTNAGVYKVKNSSFIKWEFGTGIDNAIVQNITEDSNNSIWIGTNSGAYRIKGSSITHFNAKNGLTDNSVFHIITDTENNLWFATDADGIFKYRENMFTYYDKVSGLTNPSIMGIVKTKSNEVYAAGYGGILHRITAENKIETVKGQDPELGNSRINCLYADDKDNIWIGTVGNGVWKYNSVSGLKKINGAIEPWPRTITYILKDFNGNLLVASPTGLFILNDKGEYNRINSVQNSVNCLLPLEDNTILAGTQNGVFILTREYKYIELNKKEFSNLSMLCMTKNKNNVWLGTTSKGVLCWNLKADKIYNYSKKEGLPNDFVYFIDVNEKNQALIGTGYGITDLSVDANGKITNLRNYGQPDGLIGMECNNNSVLKANDSTFWFGTAKGLFHYNPHAESVKLKPPFILLKSVKLFSSDIKDSTLYSGLSTWFNVPDNLKLAHDQNNLTFELGSIYFTNPGDIQYKYKLEGLGRPEETSSNGTINYSALPPGKYTLRVQAITKAGMLSSNTITYAFEVRKAFYQTTPFQILVVLLLIATGALMMYVIARRKQNQAKLLQKIREEEFNKLRQRTAEDFHDEMGNKLTRISVLADILRSKVNGHAAAETTNLIEQIKDNTGALYSGSRDIIWSLNAQNDGLPEIIERVNEKGVELFEETKIEFKFNHNISRTNELKLKLDYSRNLIMIFKEVYNNILKHSQANKVEVNIDLQSDNDLLIVVNDNGNGFNAAISHKGNGLKNIQNRVNRLNGELKLESESQQGTKIKMKLKNLFENGNKE